MEELINQLQEKINKTSMTFQRYLVDKMDFKNRLIALKGARGSGKTTFLLQHVKKNLNVNNTLHVSLDHLFFL